MEAFLRSLSISNFLVETTKALTLAQPTQVQVDCIPKILNGQATRAKSPTGTGKTAAFAIPIVELLSRDPYGVFALVLTPTRELALQIEQQFQAFGSNMNIKTECAVGGHDIIKQSQRLYTRIPHIV
jgi:ATP-dependent RNA helicase DDX49/DBP8